jgi:hypothetical protein
MSDEKVLSGKLNKDDANLLVTSVIIVLVFSSFPYLHKLLANNMKGGWMYGSFNLLLYLLQFLLVGYAIFSTFWLDWKKYSAKYVIVLAILIRWITLILLVVRFKA